ncbi:MAG TPA: phage tail protein [Gemmatimonadaceae bacterium]|jgi:phage tail-like protein|nr:phage tail protein [Gemmatimonadaceae bacterium]
MYPYIVKINGKIVGSFTEVSGLTSDGDVVDYREGEEGSLFPRKLPKSTGPKRITLTRGVVHDPAFAAWLRQPRIPHLVTIEHVNAAGVTIWSREIKDCAMTATHVTLAPHR